MINNLIKGDVVEYTGFDGKFRRLTYLGQNGFVKCIKGEGYTPNLVFDYEGRVMHAPYAAWVLTKMEYTVIHET